MDLDVPAYWVYLFIFVLSTFSAVSHTDQLLEKFIDRWWYPDTYLVVLVYCLLPMGVLVLMDRAGVLRDTSLLSALLVMGSYQAIIMGTASKTDSTVSSLFKPLLDWVSNIPGRLELSVNAASDNFSNAVLASIDGKPALIDKLETWVTKNRTDLDSAKRIKEAADACTKPAAGATDLDQRQWAHNYGARLLLVVGPPTVFTRFSFLFRRLIDFRTLLRGIFPSGLSLVRLALPIAMLSAVFGIGFHLFSGGRGSTPESPGHHAATTHCATGAWLCATWDSVGSVWHAVIDLTPTTDQLEQSYFEWRLVKTGSSDQDQSRARDWLRHRVNAELQKGTSPTLDDAVSLMTAPGTTAAQVKGFLDAMLVDRLSSPWAACPVLLALPPAIRTPNVEARGLVLSYLMSLTKAPSPFGWPEFATKDVPDLGTAPAGLIDEAKVVNAWTTYLQLRCLPPSFPGPETNALILVTLPPVP